MTERYFTHTVTTAFDSEEEAKAFQDRFFEWFTQQPEHEHIGYSDVINKVGAND